MNIKFRMIQSEIDKISELANQKMAESAFVIQESAKDICPVRSGELRNDIQSNYDETTKQALIYNTLEYAPFVNLGTSKMKANPYLERALMTTDLSNIWRS